MRHARQSSTNERKELEEASCELQMTPMIDVTFLLLIFFMCTLKFKTLEGTMEVYLPKDVGPSESPVAVPLERVVVRMDVVDSGTKVCVDRDGLHHLYSPADAAAGRRFQYGGDRNVRYSVGPQRGLDFHSAIDVVRGLHGRHSEADYVVDARSGVLQGEVVQVLDALTAMGITDVAFRAARVSD